jgi:branched-chain amino acid transport system permease protein
MTLLTEALILGLFAMSLDLMVGYTRLISFGHAAAYGLGAYACGWLLLHTSVPMLFAIPLAALLAGVIAIGVAWVCTQASGVSFSMLTLAFAQLLYAVAYKWTSVTGGSDGLAGIPRRPGPLALHLFVSRDGFYYLVLLVLLAAFLSTENHAGSNFQPVVKPFQPQPVMGAPLPWPLTRLRIAFVRRSQRYTYRRCPYLSCGRPRSRPEHLASICEILSSKRIRQNP